MAKNYYKAPKHITGRIVSTKTHFGSTSDMVVDLSQVSVSGDPITLQDNEVLCKDDSGYYITYKNMIDSGLADPNRYANDFRRVNESATHIS